MEIEDLLPEGIVVWSRKRKGEEGEQGRGRGKGGEEQNRNSTKLQTSVTNSSYALSMLVLKG